MKKTLITIKLTNIIKSKFLELIKFLKTKLSITQKYKINHFDIKLTADHSLPDFQKKFLFYDKFLPKLVSFLKPNTSIIDVGSNCGDTFFACYSQNKNINYYCIDAEKSFCELFNKNININSNKLNINKILVSNCLIGKNLKGFLIGSKGSKKLIQSDTIQNIKSLSLDTFAKQNIKFKVSLLKVDTDGYDYNIINSAKYLIQKQRPIIFYECYIETNKKKNKYLKLINYLSSLNYYYCIFDNYGQFIVDNCNKNNAQDLVEYLYRHNEEHKFRAIVYYDVLAYQKGSQEKLLKKSLKIYKNLKN